MNKPKKAAIALAKHCLIKMQERNLFSPESPGGVYDIGTIMNCLYVALAEGGYHDFNVIAWCCELLQDAQKEAEGANDSQYKRVVFNAISEAKKELRKRRIIDTFWIESQN